MDAYNYDNLSQLLGDTVQVSDDQGNKVDLKVAEVNKGNLDGEQWEAFSVIYTSEQAMNISQGTYHFYHPSFDNKALFLSPNSAVEFETVITRARKAKPAPQANQV